MRFRAWSMLALVLAMVVIVAMFAAYPLLISLGLATQRTFGTRVGIGVGAANFFDALGDPVLRKAAMNTAVFAFVSVLVQVPLALLAALLMDRRGVWGRGVFRLALLLPYMVGLAYAGVLGAVMFERRTGLVDRALHGMIGFDLDYPWLEVAPISAMVIISAWLYVGLNAMILRGALAEVDPSRREAAMLDGAGAFGRFRHVTLAGISPVLSLVVLLSVVGSVQAFELPYVLLGGSGGGGGGVENRGLTVVTYLYQQGFEVGDLGYASAIGWLLAFAMLVVVGAIGLFWRRVGRC